MNKLVMTLVSATLALSPALWAGEKIDQTLPTKAKGHVDLDVMSGKVNIISWDKNEVRVVGELSDDAEGYQFEGSESGHVFFKVKMPEKRWGSWSDDGSMLDIYVPKLNSLEFEGVNVDVEIKEVAGGVRMNTVNGDIKAIDLAKRIMLETVNGSVNTNKLNGDIRLGSVNGSITDRDSKGEMQIETVNGKLNIVSQCTEVELSNVNGDMKLDFGLVEEMEIGTVNGDIELSLTLDRKGRLSFSSVSGDAEVDFKGDLSAVIDIETHAGGDIYNDITDQRSNKDKFGPGESLRFTVGGGDAKVEFDTVSGDVKVRKK